MDFHKSVFIAGGTGYIGRALIPALLARGYGVRALVRKGSEGRLPAGAVPVSGDPLDSRSFSHQVSKGDTFIQLVGVPHPAPWKAALFRSVDLVSGRESVAAARSAGAAHFVYLSVAQPAPVMKTYIGVRREVESMIRAAGLNATILRPWYVLGPGHRWPLLLKPFYALGKRIPRIAGGARRLGLVTLDQMVEALVRAVENPAEGIRVWEVPQIRQEQA